MKYIATILSLLLATVLTQSQSQNQSPDGTCGGQDQFTCTNSLYGPCCSSYGYWSSPPPPLHLPCVLDRGLSC